MRWLFIHFLVFIITNESMVICSWSKFCTCLLGGLLQGYLLTHTRKKYALSLSLSMNVVLNVPANGIKQFRLVQVLLADPGRYFLLLVHFQHAEGLLYRRFHLLLDKIYLSI